MKQKISELLDEELPDSDFFEVLQGIVEDRALRGTWERYHLMRSAMRRELHIVARPVIADRIAAAIRTENVVPMGTENVVPMGRRPYGLGSSRIAKLAAGLAIAASVAAVAIVSLRPAKNGDQTQAQVQTQAVKAADRRVAAASLAAAVPEPTAPTERAAYQDALNAFLVEHGEVAPPTGMNSMMSFVRVVGYRNENSHR
ncbi:MAG: sigma-E factor negative regulatory protein [Acidiferrobacterales bacterium]